MMWTELEYLRNVIAWSIGALGILLTTIAGLSIWIYKSDQEKLLDRFDHIVEGLEKKAELRDVAIKLRFDNQDRVLDGMRNAQFDDSQSFRDLFHQHDKRIDRLEREDLRRSQQVRQGDDPRAI